MYRLSYVHVNTIDSINMYYPVLFLDWCRYDRIMYTYSQPDSYQLVCDMELSNQLYNNSVTIRS
ncbi:MAG: hypothetical protein J07HQW2_01833 [Haloquadratum walsbyi J07HQW2]|uniref:Uncharacterized protein n=1 Tax=Haloquadratum walsbyi J07HQW2 TaxID=1238425 RepID=U1NF40_9EURY|nr:MAG: hypothetical protein J07HQW2_01833 [Haloquadratum walsbyi J07HQW2]